MRLFVETLLPCGADQAWATVQTSELLHEVASPLVTIRPLPGEQFPKYWQAGSRIHCRPLLFGLLPLFTRDLSFERIDPVKRKIQTRESDRLIARWDHAIRIRAISDDACWYSDEIEIEAGWLTSFVWLFAALFYRHRQQRWQNVARRLASAAWKDTVRVAN